MPLRATVEINLHLIILIHFRIKNSHRRKHIFKSSKRLFRMMKKFNILTQNIPLLCTESRFPIGYPYNFSFPSILHPKRISSLNHVLLLIRCLLKELSQYLYFEYFDSSIFILMARFTELHFALYNIYH